MEPSLKSSALSIVLASLALAAGTAAAQPAPPRGVTLPFPGADAPPPPPGARADRPPPPPPRGPSVRVERDAGGTLRLDVHCGEAETAKSCADTTLAIFDKVAAPATAK